MSQDGAQANGRAIASAFERGVADPNRDMRPAIEALQNAARGNPEEYRQALQVANQLLDNSNNANVKRFFGNYDIIEGGDSNGLKLQKVSDGSQFIMNDRGATTKVGTNATLEAPRRTAQGDTVESGSKDGLSYERTTNADKTQSVERFEDKDGNKWQIERKKQADGTLRPTKITMPDGSSLEYEWNRQSGEFGTLLPTRMRELDKGGKVVKDYQMTSKDGRFEPSNWDKKVGPSDLPANFYGTLVVDSNGNTAFTQRDPLIMTRLNADGTFTRSGVDKQLRRINEQGRRTK